MGGTRSKPAYPAEKSADTNMKFHAPIKIAFIYAIFGISWVVVTDWLAEYLSGSPETLGTVQMFKGWAFIAATSFLVYFLARRGVAEKTASEAALERSERRFRQIMDRAPSVIYLKDLQGRYTFINRCFETLSGYGWDEVVGRTDSELFPPEVVERSTENDRRVLESGEPLQIEEIGPVGGEMHDFVSGKYPIVDDCGEICELCGISADITELKRVQKSLKESQEKLKAVFEAAEHIAFIVAEKHDGDHVILDVSPGAEKMFGFSKDELVGKTLTTLAIPEEPEKSNPAGGRYDGLEKGFKTEIDLTRKSGEMFPVLFTACPLSAEGEFSNASLFVCVDVTHRKLLEKEMFRARKMEAIEKLAGGVAHHVNNLFMGIRGYVSLMRMMTEAEESNYQMLIKIENIIGRGMPLLTRLLDFANSGGREKDFISVNELVRSICERLLDSRKEIVVHFDLDDSLAMVQADRRQIDQMLRDIIENALEAMPGNTKTTPGEAGPAGGELLIETRNVFFDKRGADSGNDSAQTYLKLSVRDTGVGMDEKTREKVFDPFFSTKEFGRGLGLASVYGIVKRLDGAVNVISGPGRGTTIEIYLPAYQDALLQEETWRKHALNAGETVFLIDSEKMVVDVIADALGLLGYRLLNAGNGRDALEIYRDKMAEIDLTLLNYVLPDMPCADVFVKLKKMNPDARIIFLTESDDRPRISLELEQSCSGFLNKPFQISQLLDKIQIAIERAPS